MQHPFPFDQEVLCNDLGFADLISLLKISDQFENREGPFTMSRYGPFFFNFGPDSSELTARKHHQHLAPCKTNIQIGNTSYTAHYSVAQKITDPASSLSRSFCQVSPLAPLIIRDAYRTQPALIGHYLERQRCQLCLDGGLVGNAHFL